ncbi:autotransporter domain-containing protein [Candidatus Tisiphia endosymbiont of Ditula angustiorana]|uniref:autotransporter domain-containing protein n=1 Tax=Candidatus Tisiphia endosymbiont of Ditula angustiorana TaxID=3066272 RepID=UPI00312C773F
MMAKKQKFFKYLLASSAIASVVASLGSSSVALGAGVQAPNGALMTDNATLNNVVGDAKWHQIDQVGGAMDPLAPAPSPPNGDAFTYGDAFTLTADRANAIITAINLNGKNGRLTVDADMSIGSIVGGNLSPTITAGQTLTLTGTAATAADHGFIAAVNTYGLGNVTLRGAASTLIVNSDDDGDITVGNVLAGIHEQGVLTFITGGGVGTIGADGASLLTVNIGDKAVTLSDNVWAKNTNLAHANSVLKLADNKTITGDILNTKVDPDNANGTLTFEGIGRVTGNIGAADVLLSKKSLATINIGNGAVTLDGHVWAKNTNLTDANSVLNVGGGKTINGAITTAINGKGTLTFAAVGTVTGDIGTDGARLAQININTATALRGSVYTDDLNFVGARPVTIGGHFKGKVTFDAANAGMLIFNGAAAGEPYTFDSTIVNGHQGTLNVRTNLQATNKDIGKIKTINIGAAGGHQTLLIDASADDVHLLDDVGGGGGNQTIIFGNAASALSLYTENNNRTIIFHNDLAGFAGGVGGFVWMDSNNAILTLESAAGGGAKLGTGNNLTGLSVGGKVTIAGGANGLDISRADRLLLVKGAEFTDNSATSAKIEDIRIGEVGVPATYILDAKHGGFDLNATKADQITFNHADSQLVLRNSDAAADRTITLLHDLDPGVGADGKGIVKLHSVVDGKTLTIAGVGLSLGTGGNNLKKVIFSGAGKFNTQQITIHSKNIELNVNELTLGAVNSNILFAINTVLTANGNITGNVDFQNNDGTVSLAHTKNITGSVTSTGTGNAKGTLAFLGEGRVTGSITNLKMLKVGAGDVQLAGGNHTITEIQGNGTSNLIFTDNFNLTGSINSTGGTAVGLIFKGNSGVSGISGVVGTATNPVGTIEVEATTKFGNKVQTGNSQNIIIYDKAIAEFADIVTTGNIKGKAKDQGTVKFSNTNSMTINSTIGAENPVDTLEIAGADVKITKAVSANNISFSNKTQSTTLTLGGPSIVGGIRVDGNNVHTLELAADFTTGVQDIGSENNRLKSIKLLGDHKITIRSAVYSDVSTETNNTGKVVFDSDKSFAYDLGTDKLKLSAVTFYKNATVKGDVYSKQITIAKDKTATFAGTKNRTISVPNFTVDGSSLSRLLKSFAYSTQIVSDEIKNAGIAKFNNAVLIDAKINGGKVTFADNVWFKQTAEGTEASFAADKFVILEQNIRFANIKADKAKIIILPKTASITGNLAAKDFTVDLAANKLQYTGQAQLTGKIELVTAYDTSNGAGGNIEVQTGSKLDLSKADELMIKVKAQTDLNKIPKGVQYVVISSVDGKGLVAIDNSKIKFDPTGEQNRFVQWSMDSSELKLYITDISKEVIAKEIADKSLPQEDREFYTQLNNVTDRNSSAGKFRSNIGLMDRKHALQAIEKLLPGNEHPIGESLAKTSAIMGTLISQTAIQIASRQSMRMHNPASAIGSGDDDQVMYGVWGSPFYGTACQETYKGVSGYKSKSAGGIVGFDGLVNDNLLLGAAYSRINTQMSHQDQKVGDKTNGKTNIFSLYSLYDFPNNWFTEAIASYGITRVKNSEGRLIATKVKTVTALETAAAKYKSISYSGQLLAGYNYQASEKLMITPTIGLRYLQFKDSGYTETGTKFQNLAVKKRSYNKLEGILGLRTAITLKVNEVLLIPELHGYVNHDFKGKAPIIDARLDGINEPLPTRLVKPAKTSFTVGTGLTAKYNMMECGVAYNANIASKYIGHQGSLKVKVNF